MDLTLDVSGDVQLHRTIMRWSDAVVDFAPAFAALVVDFHKMEAEQFSSEGAFASGGWAPLAESTVTERERLGIGGAAPILDRTGAGEYGSKKNRREGGTGKRSLTETNAPFAVTTVTPEEFFVGSSDPVMGYHQRGHDSPTTLPQRRPVEMREQDRVRWVKVLQAWIVGVEPNVVLSGPLGL